MELDRGRQRSIREDERQRVRRQRAEGIREVVTSRLLGRHLHPGVRDPGVLLEADIGGDVVDRERTPGGRGHGRDRGGQSGLRDLRRHDPIVPERAAPAGTPRRGARHSSPHDPLSERGGRRVRAAVRPGVPRPGGDLLRRQGRRRRRRPDVHLPDVGGADAPAARMRSSASASSPATGSRSSPTTRTTCSRATTASPRPGRSSTRSTSGSRRTRSPTSSSTPARGSSSSTATSRRSSSSHRAEAHDAPAASSSSRASRGGIASDEYEALIAGGSAGAAPPARRRERDRRALLHERHDGPAEGRRPEPAEPLPARPERRDRARLRRGRRRPPRRAALPRERLGRPPLRDDDRRAPRDAPPVRPGRLAGGCRAPPGHAPARRPGDLQRRAPPRRARHVRPLEPAPGHHRRLAGLARARAGARGGRWESRRSSATA